MNKKVFFTICAKNYIGLARVLEKSIRLVNPECAFFVFVADEMPEKSDMSVPDNVLTAKDILRDHIDARKWHEMAFKYNLTEFCTSIKSFCFKYLFETLGFDKVIYLDPDIFVYSSFDSVFSHLNDYKIILTPHVTTFSDVYQGARAENGILHTGVYNLGFLALRKSEEVDLMLNWWGERLKECCYIDALDAYFTDQRWMDFLPSFFSNRTILISRHLGMNVAPWNFHERELYQDNEIWYVRNRKTSGIDMKLGSTQDTLTPLVFVHFSGYDYRGLITGNLVQNNLPELKEYTDINSITSKYGDFLKQEILMFNSFIHLLYTYSVFDNGVHITHFQRRIFRALVEEGHKILAPFETSPNSFYSRLLKKRILLKSDTGGTDRFTKLNMPDTASKLRKINWLMRILFGIIGVKYYSLILRLMRPYSRIENHIHLYDSHLGNKLR